MSSLTQNIEKKSIRRNKIFRKSLTKNLRRAFEIVQKLVDKFVRLTVFKTSINAHDMLLNDAFVELTEVK